MKPSRETWERPRIGCMGRAQDQVLALTSWNTAAHREDDLPLSAPLLLELLGPTRSKTRTWDDSRNFKRSVCELGHCDIAGRSWNLMHVCINLWCGCFFKHICISAWGVQKENAQMTWVARLYQYINRLAPWMQSFIPTVSTSHSRYSAKMMSSVHSCILLRRLTWRAGRLNVIRGPKWQVGLDCWAAKHR